MGLYITAPCWLGISCIKCGHVSYRLSYWFGNFELAMCLYTAYVRLYITCTCLDGGFVYEMWVCILPWHADLRISCLECGSVNYLTHPGLGNSCMKSRYIYYIVMLAC